MHSDKDVPQSAYASASDDHVYVPAEPMWKAPYNGNVESAGDEIRPHGSGVARRQKIINDRLCMFEDHIASMVAFVRDMKESIAVVSQLKKTVDTLLSRQEEVVMKPV